MSGGLLQSVKKVGFAWWQRDLPGSFLVASLHHSKHVEGCVAMVEVTANTISVPVRALLTVVEGWAVTVLLS